MKKILALLLSIALSLSMLMLVSCGEPEDGDTVETLNDMTPEELYAHCREKLQNATSYSIVATQRIKMTYQGEKITTNQKVTNKVDGDNYYTQIDSDSLMGTELDMEAWYVDGIMYINSAGTKIKGEFDQDAFMQEYMGTDPSESTLLNIPESWFEDIVFERDDDLWVLSFDISGEKYNEMLNNVGLGSAEIVGDVIYKLYFDDDGNIEKLVSEFDMDVSGITARCDTESIITIEDIDINAPADADSYQTTKLH